MIFLLATEPLLRRYSPTYDNGCTIVSGLVPIVSDGRNNSRTVLCSFQQPLSPIQVWRAICFMPIYPLSCFPTTKSVSLLEFPTTVYWSLLDELICRDSMWYFRKVANLCEQLGPLSTCSPQILLKLNFFLFIKPKVVYLRLFLSFLPFPKFFNQNFMCFGHKHVDI